MYLHKRLSLLWFQRYLPASGFLDCPCIVISEMDPSGIVMAEFPYRVREGQGMHSLPLIIPVGGISMRVCIAKGLDIRYLWYNGNCNILTTDAWGFSKNDIYTSRRKIKIWVCFSEFSVLCRNLARMDNFQPLFSLTTFIIYQFKISKLSGGKAAGAWRSSPTRLSAEVKNA